MPLPKNNLARWGIGIGSTTIVVVVVGLWSIVSKQLSDVDSLKLANVQISQEILRLSGRIGFLESQVQQQLQQSIKSAEARIAAQDRRIRELEAEVTRGPSSQ